MSRLCALVLAAGEGRRLRPLTRSTPKALCPVGNVPMLDRVLVRLAQHGLSGATVVAVNACYLYEQVADHVGARAHMSVEPGPPALGTAGAVANLRDWIAGRDVLVGNADAFLAPAGSAETDLSPLLEEWDGLSVRVLCVSAGQGRRAEFRGPGREGQQDGAVRFAGFTLLPWSWAAALSRERSELVTRVWRPAEAAACLELIRYDGVFYDCGTPADYLAANLHAAGTGSLIAPQAMVSGTVDRAVIGAGAQVRGAVTRSVVWPGGHVGPEEHLVDAVRSGRDVTMVTSG